MLVQKHIFSGNTSIKVIKLQKKNAFKCTTFTSGGVEGGVLAACFKTKLLRRMSVPGGGPSK